MNVNKIMCTGRLTKDPELRQVSEDMKVCQLRLAVDGMGRGREVGYVNVAVFGKAGEACGEYLAKGWLVAVDGRLEYGEWETFPTGQLGLPHGAKALSVVAIGRNGAPIEINRGGQPFRLPARFWERPEKPPSGACALTAPSSYKPFRGTTAVRLEPNPDVEGAALTSCLSVDYKVAATTLTAAVLVNAKSPRSAPPALFGASAVTGRPGFVNREEDTGLHTSTRIAFTARRDGNAWIVVEGGRGLAQRIHALRSLHVARIQVSGSDRSSGWRTSHGPPRGVTITRWPKDGIRPLTRGV